MTNPKRPESLDQAIWILNDWRRCAVREGCGDDVRNMDDALDVLRAERERRRGQ
jgi:hypothetical protein